MALQSIAAKLIDFGKDYDPRTVKADKEADAQLQASITAHGVLLPILVAANENGGFTAIDGRRRLAAFIKVKGKDAEIPAQVMDAKDVSPTLALEMATAANTVREDMNPLDEFLAYAEVAKADGVEAVMKHFAVDRRYVEQVLALGNLSPKVHKAYRAGEIRDDELRAYTLITDKKTQEALLKDHAPAWQIRKIATEHRYPVRAALFDPALAKGGIVRNLFDEHDQGFFADTEEFLRLQQEALDARIAAYKAEGWGTVEVREHFTWQEQQAFEPVEGTLDPKVKAEIDDITSKMNVIENKLEALYNVNEEEPTDETQKLEDDLEALREKGEALERESVLTYTPEAKAAGMVIVTTDKQSGRVEFFVGIRPKKAARKEAAAEAKEKAKAKPDAGYSANLIADLVAVKSHIVQHSLADDSDLSLRWLVFQILDNSQRFEPARTGIVITDERTALVPAKETAHDKKIDADTAVKGARNTALWLKVKEMKNAQLLRILAAHVRHSLGFTTGGKNEIEDDIAHTLGVEMQEHWRPNEAFFARLPKAEMAKIVTEVAGKAKGTHILGLKKAAAVAACVKLFADAASGKLPVKEAGPINAWLPPVMRLGKAKK